MKCRIDVDPGVCGFKAAIVAVGDDMAAVTFEIVSDCEKIRKLAGSLSAGGAIDAYGEVGAGSDGRLLSAVRANLRGCCAACAVGIATFKAMQVAAGLALPRDVQLKITKE